VSIPFSSFKLDKAKRQESECSRAQPGKFVRGTPKEGNDQILEIDLQHKIGLNPEATAMKP
jgi:hypothetical protein